MTTHASAQDKGSRPVALVTGAGRGIGRAIAARLAAAGFDLEMTVHESKDIDNAEAAAAGVASRTTCVDFTDRGATDRWLADVKTRRTSLTAIVHNAGVGGPDDPDEAAEERHLDRVLAINATAPMRISRALLPIVPRDGSGRVVIIASVLGRMGVAGFAAYCTSKSAVIGLGRAMARDVAKHRITVNMICPGWTETAMAYQGFGAIAAATGKTPAEARRDVEAGLPLGRIVQPSEVAALVEFLVSPGAAMMTGQTINMCAGDLQK